MSTHIFTSESVTEGHPDKVCDQIADAVLDAVLIAEENEATAKGLTADDAKAAVAKARVACETLVTEGTVVLAGELRTSAYVDTNKVARQVIEQIGYTHPDLGFSADSVGILNSLHEQSPDIALGVDNASDPFSFGAGDQGFMFGYACNQTAELMPLPIMLAHRLTAKLAEVRHNGTLEYLRPDGKSQVSIEYDGNTPQALNTILISTQHTSAVKHAKIESDLREAVVQPVLQQLQESDKVADYAKNFYNDFRFIVNPTGQFIVGGPKGDTGVTGRKIIVDTYGGYARHGGGAFSGKDATKVDRSASYAARYVAKNVVAAGLADEAELQIAYAIGQAEPVSVAINTKSKAACNHSDEQILAAIQRVFDLRPGAIISELDLWQPIFQQTSNYGHFGRELPEFTWERTDKVDALLSAL